ncbi:MAG: hypothetical protein EPN93_06615 [Spirochaetes bacterium]|nr:MAG: hypothetical protein EPN93_06615 [Spirochaetota bacterium]
MNSDISIMTELQRYWDSVLRGREEMEKCAKSIRHWRARMDDGTAGLAALDEEIKALKTEIGRKELDLADRDGKAKKLAQRRDMLKTERELEALGHEVAAINAERGALEEDLIRLMDTLDGRNAARVTAARDLEELSAQSGKDIAMLGERAARFEKTIAENQGKFDALLPTLGAAFRAKFQKLTLSPNGIAVARVEGETCGGCRMQIPAHVAQDASREDRIVNCTNCGRFIYR